MNWIFSISTRLIAVLISLCFLYIFLIPEASLSKTLSGKVVGIPDGDTIKILDSSKQQYRIRLYGIDCPEDGQPFGKAAKKHTARLTAGKNASIVKYDIDKYGRIVGVVIVDGINVNRSLLELGLAWQYRKYCSSEFCDEWLSTEEQAKRSGIGLWKSNDPIPPWEWRKGLRDTRYLNTRPAIRASITGYHGNIKSHKFHSSNCRHYNCKNCTKFFVGRKEAIAVGYSPCGRCKP